MLSTIKATVLASSRKPEMWIWMLFFPLALATMFIFMFDNLKNPDSIAAVPVAIVQDDAWKRSGFSQVVDALAAEGDGGLLDVTAVCSVEEGGRLLDEGQVSGVYYVDPEASEYGKPQVILGAGSASTDGTSQKSIDRSILETVASSFTQMFALTEASLDADPGLLDDPSAISRALEVSGKVKRISLTRSTPDDTVRFYYALLGMAALFASELAAGAAIDAAGDLSALGARRCVGGQSRLAMLTGTLLGCWAVAACCLTVVFLFVRFVAGVDFAGREGLALLGIAAASLLAISIGMLVSMLPIKGGKSSRTGLLTLLNCTGSLFAGLYGMPAMRLADEVACACPAEAWLNPPKLISDMFTSLYFYEGLGPFFARVAVCAGLGVALLLITAAVFRRQRYEHL